MIKHELQRVTFAKEKTLVAADLQSKVVDKPASRHYIVGVFPA